MTVKWIVGELHDASITIISRVKVVKTHSNAALAGDSISTNILLYYYVHHKEDDDGKDQGHH